MPDLRTAKLAETLVNYCTSVRPGDWVLVRSHVAALPLAEQVLEQVAKAGGNPTVQLYSEDLDEPLLRHASLEQLAWVSPLDEIMAEKLDVRIVISAASNTRALSGLDAKRQQVYQSARRKFQQTLMQRSAEGSHRWVGTLFPCPAFAQEADMSLSEYENFVYAATYADQPDPTACWHKVHDEQQRLVDWLRGKDHVVVRGPDVDLRLSIKDRVFANSDGKRNMPSGEIFTGPVEDSVNGWVKFTYPANYGGTSVEGAELTFSNGRVTTAKADKNQDFLLKTLDTDAGSRSLGEFAIGTNFDIQRFTGNILFDEKIGGSFHMALGAGYPETGSKNKSAIHWDMICDMRTDSTIHVDGDLFYQDGQFTV